MDIIIGITLIVIGIGSIFFSLRYPPKSEFGLLPSAKGIIGGIFVIMLGILYIIGRNSQLFQD